MLTERQIKSIRKLYHEDCLSVERIATRKGCCVNTVYKYLKQPYETAEEKELRDVESKLAPYYPTINGWLIDDSRRYAKQRHTALRVYNRLCELFPDFDCSYKIVQRYYKKFTRQVYKDNKPVDDYRPLPGEAEISCTAFKCSLNGKKTTAYMLLMVFPYSLAAYVQIIKGRNTESILSGLQRIYEHLGGIPPVQSFLPNTKLYKYAVHDIEDATDDLLIRFIMYHDFKDNYVVPDPERFDTRCGKIASYLHKRLFPQIVQIKDLAAINEKVLFDCDDIMRRFLTNRKAHVKDLFFDDRSLLLPLPNMRFDVTSYRKQKVNRFCEVVVENHRYFMTPALKNRFVYVYRTEDKIHVHNLLDEPIQSFDRVYSDSPTTISDYKELLFRLRTKSQALLNSKFVEILPEHFITFLKAQTKSIVRSYIFAMFKICVETDVETAVKYAALASHRNCSNIEEVMRVYSEAI